MGLYQIEIDDEKITEQMNRILSDILDRQMRSQYTDSGKVMSAAIKDLIYSHKDEIIEKVVDRASTEIVKKAMPKLMAKLTE